MENPKKNAEETEGGKRRRRVRSKKDQEEKEPDYRLMIRPGLAEELYEGILRIIITEKKYRDPSYSAKQLAIDLKTNTRYISAVVNSCFGKNFSSLINEYRVKDALRLLVDRRYAGKTIEEISAMVGFSNRQSFYTAFGRITGETPHNYRKRNGFIL